MAPFKGRLNLLNTSSNIKWANRIETISRPILGLAYIISVAFYLKLLSAFALRGFGYSNIILENSLTSLILLFIGLSGKFKGLSLLEMMETYSVNTKLAIIAAVIATHLFYNVEILAKGQWILKNYPHESWWISIRKVLGMLIIIQGFETSRYLGQAYNTKTRIQTMRYAQWISGIIYITFVTLAMIVFNGIHHVSETTIIDLCGIVAPVLPILLVIAVIMSQFSAAVADTAGSCGLLSEASHKKLSTNNSYLYISLIGIGLTWFTNIYEIITIASKAFAIYYGLEVLLTIAALHRLKNIKSRSSLQLFYLAILIIILFVIVFGIPVE